MFNLFKNKSQSDIDISNVSNDNINNYLKEGKLVLVYLISPDFGGSSGMDNQVPVTPKAYKEKQVIDNELIEFLKQGKKVKNFNIKMEHKNHSIVPSKMLITATIDDNDYNKVIDIW